MSWAQSVYSVSVSDICLLSSVSVYSGWECLCDVAQSIPVLSHVTPVSYYVWVVMCHRPVMCLMMCTCYDVYHVTMCTLMWLLSTNMRAVRNRNKSPFQRSVRSWVQLIPILSCVCLFMFVIVFLTVMEEWCVHVVCPCVSETVRKYTVLLVPIFGVSLWV